VKVFLKGLARTGNVRLAAAGAGVDFTSAYQRRKRHAEFAERWEGALAAHTLRVEQSGRDGREGEEVALTPPLPSAAPSLSLDGRGELNARPDGKVIKGSAARWGKRAEEAFLLELTVSASVKLAAAAAGFSTVAVYKRRLKDSRFAAAWEAALETGKARVQAYLVEAATRTFDPDELPIGDESEIPKVSIGEAINIAKMPAAGQGRAGAPSGKGWGIPGRTYDDTGFDTTPITRDEWEEAGRNIVNRLERIRLRTEQEERETGRCHACGQPLPGDPGAAQSL
jgi:hypothetical protein